MFGRYFEKILKERTINLLKSEIIDYKKRAVEKILCDYLSLFKK